MLFLFSACRTSDVVVRSSGRVNLCKACTILMSSFGSQIFKLLDMGSQWIIKKHDLGNSLAVEIGLYEHGALKVVEYLTQYDIQHGCQSSVPTE